MEKDISTLFRIDGRVVVITGAAGLLGVRHAEVVAAHGGHPVCLDLSQQAVDDLSGRLNKRYGVEASGYAVDITDERQVEDNVKALVERYGKIDGLVNNAANNPKVEESSEKNFSRLENFSLDVWNQDIAVGLSGAFLCAKHFGHQISRNPEGGSIVNISSDLGIMAPDQRLYKHEGLPEAQQAVKPVTYSVVKSGMVGLTLYLSTYWADRNVRCNAMCPGGVKNGQPQDFLNKVHTRIPMNRLATPNEYQGTLLWMLSDASSYLNGAIVPIDGGRTAW